MIVQDGKSVFGGIAIGKIALFEKGDDPVKRKTIEDTNEEIKRFENAKEKAYRYCMKKKQTGEFLKFSGFYVWFLIVPLTAVTLLFKWKNGFLRWVSTFLYGGTCAFLIHIEWIYLAMNGRFPL